MQCSVRCRYYHVAVTEQSRAQHSEPLIFKLVRYGHIMIHKVAIWIYSSAASEIATGGLQTRCLALVRDYHKCPDTALSAVIGGE